MTRMFRAEASRMEGVSITGFFSAGCVWLRPDIAIETVTKNTLITEQPGLRISTSTMALLRASKIKYILDCMADRLYLNIWFPSFAEPEMLPRLLSVLKQFPYSSQRAGVGYMAVRSISWDEPILFQQTFDYRADPETALALAGEFLHKDNAYELDVLWDLWVPVQEGDLDQTWELRPQTVKFIAFGTDFEDATYQENGHIQVDLGLDAPFLYEEAEFTNTLEQRIKANVQKLVGFSNAVEKNCGISGRLLWSESEDNLAQKLIERLQRVQ